jgi:hypothetical protein
MAPPFAYALRTSCMLTDAVGPVMRPRGLHLGTRQYARRASVRAHRGFCFTSYSQRNVDR